MDVCIFTTVIAFFVLGLSFIFLVASAALIIATYVAPEVNKEYIQPLAIKLREVFTEFVTSFNRKVVANELVEPEKVTISDTTSSEEVPEPAQFAT